MAILKLGSTFTDGRKVAALESPTFTGTVNLPSTTNIGNVSSTELGYLDGVTSSIQTQLDGKVPTALSNSSITRNANSTVNTVVTMGKTYTLTYNADGSVNTINDGSSTKTCSYTNGLLGGIA